MLREREDLHEPDRNVSRLDRENHTCRPWVVFKMRGLAKRQSCRKRLPVRSLLSGRDAVAAILLGDAGRDGAGRRNVGLCASQVGLAALRQATSVQRVSLPGI